MVERFVQIENDVLAASAVGELPGSDDAKRQWRRYPPSVAGVAAATRFAE
jgi:hypothetical protein